MIKDESKRTYVEDLTGDEERIVMEATVLRTSINSYHSELQSHLLRRQFKSRPVPKGLVRKIGQARRVAQLENLYGGEFHYDVATRKVFVTETNEVSLDAKL